MVQTFLIWSGALFWILIIALFSWVLYDDWKDRKKMRRLYKTAFEQLDEQAELLHKFDSPGYIKNNIIYDDSELFNK